MRSKVTCRHCGEVFLLRPDKPGRRNECEPCLQAKAAPKHRTYYGENIQWLRDHFRKIVEEKLDAKGEGFTREQVEQGLDQILDNIRKAGGIVELPPTRKFKRPEPQTASSQSQHAANWVEREPSPPPEFKWGRPSQGGLPSLGKNRRH